jgi:urease gamma subunit
MEKFDVHKWNRKRRLAEIDDRIYTGQSSERQEQALEDLANAIEELEISGVFDDGNKMAEFLLNKAYNKLSKAMNE